MAKKRKTKRKTSKRRGALRGMRAGAGKEALLFLTNVVTANLAHEGLYLLGKTGIMAPAPLKAGEKGLPFNWKSAAASGALTLIGGGFAIMSKNEWLKTIGTGVGVGASIYTKDEIILPLVGLGAVDDFLDLYKRDEPLSDLNGIESNLAGDDLRLKLA